MQALRDWVRGGLPALGAAIPLTVVMVTVLSIILTAAQDLALSPAQTASWILALYGLPGLCGEGRVPAILPALLAGGAMAALTAQVGPAPEQLSLPASSLVGGEQAGERHQRHRAVYIVGAVALLIGLLAAVAAALPEIVPRPLLLALAGLAMIGVLANALQTVTEGPLLLGPLFAFAIALSEISLWGFGPYFWALVIGMGVSLFLERDELRRWRAPEGAP